MNTRRTALSFAAVGTVAGVAGLVLLASPAGAGEAPPALPRISAEELVESVLATEQVPALAGTVQLDNNLGLPVPGMPATMGDGDGVRVYTDGEGRGRIALAERDSETTVVDDGDTVWVWDSDERTVRKVPHDAVGDQKPFEGQLADPATAAKELVTALQADSTVTVDGTARIAERPVYQLVLTPKPTERTLVREVRVSVDSELRVPLQLEVLANGQADPALKVGFTEFTAGAQDPALFQFTPPAGATITEHDGDEQIEGQTAEDWLSQVDLQSVGEGWDTVVTGQLPEDALNLPAGESRGQDTSALEMLGSFGKEVRGEFGTGWVISTSVGTALVTEDGRVALGAVPEQVVTEALSK